MGDRQEVLLPLEAPLDISTAGQARAFPVRPRLSTAVLRFLWPSSIVLAALLGLGGGLWIGTGYVRSWQRHAEYTAPVHPDRSEVAVPVARQVPDVPAAPPLPADAVALQYRDTTGAPHRVVASQRDVTAYIRPVWPP